MKRDIDKRTLNQYVTFFIDQEQFAFPLNQVKAIIRPPKMTKVPKTPTFVEGIANVRETIMVVINGRNLLNLATKEFGPQTRVVVLANRDQQMGFVVDQISGVRPIEDESIASYTGEGSQWINRVSKNKDHSITMIMDIQEVFQSTKLRVGDLQHDSEERGDSLEAQPTIQDFGQKKEEIKQYVRFNIGKESYGLSVSDVHDIVRIPQNIDRLPGAPSYLIGLGVLRDQVVPIIKLSDLLEIETDEFDFRSRVILAELSINDKKIAVGLAVNSVNEVLRLSAQAIDHLPYALQTKDTDYIKGVYKETTQETNKLMYILDLKLLVPWENLNQFVSDIKDSDSSLISKMKENEQNNLTAKADRNHHANLYLIFKLDEETFGLNVQSVKEILRIPTIQPVAHSPHFLLGVANIRGHLVSVFDLRTRLGFSEGEATKNQRIIILEHKDQMYGFVVDRIKEVRKIGEDLIEDIGHTSSEMNDEYLSQVAKLKNNQMVMMLNLQKVCQWT